MKAQQEESLWRSEEPQRTWEQDSPWLWAFGVNRFGKEPVSLVDLAGASVAVLDQRAEF